MKIQIIAVLALFLSVSIIFAQEKVVVAGSGNLNDEITDIAKAYMAKNPGDVIDVRQEHMSTTGGIEGVQSGRLQIGLISRRLTDQEKNKLVYRALARSIAVVSVNKAIAITSLSETQICELF